MFTHVLSGDDCADEQGAKKRRKADVSPEGQDSIETVPSHEAGQRDRNRTQPGESLPFCKIHVLGTWRTETWTGQEDVGF